MTSQPAVARDFENSLRPVRYLRIRSTFEARESLKLQAEEKTPG